MDTTPSDENALLANDPLDVVEPAQAHPDAVGAGAGVRMGVLDRTVVDLTELEELVAP